MLAETERFIWENEHVHDNQYIHHFKSGFPYVAAQSFNEEKMNMGITIAKSDQARK